MYKRAVSIHRDLMRKSLPHSTGVARALSKLGYCSRSQACVLITGGRVRLNGRLIFNPQKPTVPGMDVIEVDGRKVGLTNKVYLMLNKPRGIVTTASDEKGRETVYSLLPEGLPWIAPVGRLDKASEGLLLMTNDSSWGARITSPKSHLEKTYHVQIAGIADQDFLNRFMIGIKSKEGDFLRAKRAAMVRAGKNNCWLEIVLDEGKNRHIRRLLEACEIEVLRLVRISIGDLRLGDLGKGRVRELSPQEETLFG
jgi:23S rRNA pseudouridine2605 synthase